jgi:hypothetical protein
MNRVFTEHSACVARRHAAVAVIVCAAATSTCAPVTQPTNPSSRDLLSVARPLTNTEIETIFSASRKALTAKTFRLVAIGGSHGPEVLMGRAGQPKIVRLAGAVEGGTVGGVVFGEGSSSPPVATRWRGQFISLTNFTGRPARHCNESVGQDELVVDYTRDIATKGWTVTARQRHAGEFGGPGIAPIFEMLQGARPMASGERRRIRNHWARAFIAPWIPPSPSPPPLLIGDPIPNVRGDPIPNETMQSLWVDTKSLLPLRWEVSKRGLLAFGFDFTYSSIDLRLPAGIDTPDCIR